VEEMNLVERLRDLGKRTVGILREPLIDAADRIEQLEAEVAELIDNKCAGFDRVFEALKDDPNDPFDRKWSTICLNIYHLQEQLTAHEATIAKLREALSQIEYLESHNGSILSAGECSSIATEALSIPAPTEHLMAYRSDVLEEAAKVCDFHDDDDAINRQVKRQCAGAILAMRGKK
jgi:uncharacterized protein (UPF0335 family)